MSGEGVDPEPVLDIEERLRVLCGHLNVVHAELVELAAEALASGSWQGHGVKSLAHWLTWQAGIGPGRAREVVRLAEARTTHPAVMSTFAAGAVSIDQAAIAVKAPADLDEQFAELATVATVAQLRVLVRAASPAPPSPRTDEAPVESFSAGFDDDGRYRFDGELDPDHGRVVDAALAEARDALFNAGRTDVTWADALVEIAERSMDTAPVQRRERFRVNWFLDLTDAVPARWTDGIAVPDWLRDHLLCDGTVSPTFTAGGLPVSVGRTQHTVPDRTRRLVIRIADHPNGLTFTDSHGRTIDPATRPKKPTGPPPNPAHPYQHPLGERLQRSAIMFPDPPRPPPNEAAA